MVLALFNCDLHHKKEKPPLWGIAFYKNPSFHPWSSNIEKKLKPLRVSIDCNTVSKITCKIQLALRVLAVTQAPYLVLPLQHASERGRASEPKKERVIASLAMPYHLSDKSTHFPKTACRQILVPVQKKLPWPDPQSWCPSFTSGLILLPQAASGARPSRRQGS